MASLLLRSCHRALERCLPTSALAAASCSWGADSCCLSRPSHAFPADLGAASSSSTVPLTWGSALGLRTLITTSFAASEGAAAASSQVLAVKPHLVEQLLAMENQSKGEQLRTERLEAVKEFQRHPGDCGSPEVMVALWTHRIRQLAEHFKVHRKHLHEMRKLERMLNQRRRMLMYMRRQDFPAYCYTLRKLGLKDIYTETRKEDRYAVGSRHSDPPEAHGHARVATWRFRYHTKHRTRKTTMWARLSSKISSEDPQAVVV